MLQKSHHIGKMVAKQIYFPVFPEIFCRAFDTSKYEITLKYRLSGSDERTLMYVECDYSLDFPCFDSREGLHEQLVRAR